MKGKIDHTLIPGYKTPEDRICLYCGKFMQPFIVWKELPDDTEETENVVRRYGKKMVPLLIKHYGYGPENLFCTLTCGYHFACWKVREDK